MENKKLTALEARALADTSERFITRVYRLIKTAASEGRTAIIYDIYECSQALVNKVMTNLSEAGYAVEIITEFNEEKAADIPVNLLISW